ncbi:MAG: amidohydrolase [Acidobacteriaceae bacterium]|nr:amidohydrolase [Acidobacteriaceae bacterium]
MRGRAGLSAAIRRVSRACAVLLCTGLASAAAPSITLILVHGKIWTVNPQQKEAEAVAIEGNRIAAVGSDREILDLKQASTRVLDLKGRRVLPGFNDAHVHFYSGGADLAGPQLRYSKSERDFRDTLGSFARQLPKGEWITGGEWDHENWSPARLPARQLIDPVTKDWPVFVSRLDGHMGLANSLALKLASVDRNTKDVPGGVIVRDASGEPTGILKDAAQGLVERIIPAPNQKQIRVAIRAAEDYANRAGVTSVQDMSAAPDIFRAYQTMLRAGELHVRISGHQPLVSWERLADVGLLADFGNEHLHIGGVKGFADGSLGSTTALLFQPYLDSPGTSGITSAELANPEKMAKNIEGADAAGLQIAIHAIGDRANDIILGMYEAVAREHGPRDRRWRIEHAQHLTAADIPRFARLHVIPSMQPYHCIDDGRWAEKRIGPERAKTTYAFRSLLDSGASLAFGSDWPVAPMSPLMGIYAAVTRRTLDGKHPDGWVPEQKITVEEAVRAYTMGSAYASFEDKIKGSIEPGKLADLIVLSDDIFSIDPVKIADTKVAAVILDGKFVMGELPPPQDPSGLLLRN